MNHWLKVFFVENGENSGDEVVCTGGYNGHWDSNVPGRNIMEGTGQVHQSQFGYTLCVIQFHWALHWKQLSKHFARQCNLPVSFIMWRYAAKIWMEDLILFLRFCKYRRIYSNPTWACRPKKYWEVVIYVWQPHTARCKDAETAAAKWEENKYKCEAFRKKAGLFYKGLGSQMDLSCLKWVGGWIQTIQYHTVVLIWDKQACITRFKLKVKFK